LVLKREELAPEQMHSELAILEATRRRVVTLGIRDASIEDLVKRVSALRDEPRLATEEAFGEA